SVERGTGILPDVANASMDPHSSSVSVANGFAIIEAAFENATRIVLGKPLKNLKEYGEWLGEYDIGTRTVRSAVSDKTVYAPAFSFYLPLMKNFVKVGEALELGKRGVAKGEIERMDLNNASEMLRGIAYFSPEIVFGKNMNIIESGDYQDDNNIYRCSFGFNTKNAAYSFFPKFCEDVYGCNLLLYCKYCLRCRTSTNLSRCFEVTDSNACSDCYFCHNCENVQESMFCFNAKGLKYAIGNMEVGKEEYTRIKRIVLDEIGERLEKDRDLKLSIYDIGAKR
ncbi:MAG: hypothetical protein PHS02_04070, partial [Candidatus ainarchaeum sp.]|nr:hypothetical protein [Candidatus ainarchaeum sp.]